jgi:uncharacterized protein (DUF433 family)
VWDVLDMLAGGMSEDEILRDYPYLEKADFPAVYAYASQAGRERMIAELEQSSRATLVIRNAP